MTLLFGEGWLDKDYQAITAVMQSNKWRDYFPTDALTLSYSIDRAKKSIYDVLDCFKGREIEALNCYEENFTESKTILNKIEELNIRLTAPEENSKSLKYGQNLKGLFPKNLYFMNNLRYLKMEVTGWRWERIDLQYFPSIEKICYTFTGDSFKMRFA